MLANDLIFAGIFYLLKRNICNSILQILCKIGKMLQNILQIY